MQDMLMRCKSQQLQIFGVLSRSHRMEETLHSWQFVSHHLAVHKVSQNTLPTSFHCCIAPNSLGLLCVSVEPRRSCSNDRSQLMFYLIQQSKGEQKHHTSTCHCLFGHLTQSLHLSVCFLLQGLQIQIEQHVQPNVEKMDFFLFIC